MHIVVIFVRKLFFCPHYPDSPTFFQQCDGYNGTLEPSQNVGATIFITIANQQTNFFQRFEGRLVGSHLGMFKPSPYHNHVPIQVGFKSMILHSLHNLALLMNCLLW